MWGGGLASSPVPEPSSPLDAVAAADRLVHESEASFGNTMVLEIRPRLAHVRTQFFGPLSENIVGKVAQSKPTRGNTVSHNPIRFGRLGASICQMPHIGYQSCRKGKSR